MSKATAKFLKSISGITGSILRTAINENRDILMDLLFSPWKTVSDTSYTISDSDNQTIIFFDSATDVTITLGSDLNQRIECLCVKDGVGNLVFTDGDADSTIKAVGLTFTDQYGGVTVIRRDDQTWSVLGNLI